MTSVTYKIPNISCNHCVHTIVMEIGDIEGVESVQADADTKTARIQFGPPATEEMILSLLAEINYPAEQS